MKVYRMNDTEWVCAPSEEQAKVYYHDKVGFSEDEINEDFQGEVSLKDKISDEHGDISFEQLIDMYSIKEPCIVATTEK